MNSLLHFLNMDGYACYIWPAYIIVFVLLLLQWFAPFKAWRRYLRNKPSKTL